MVRPSPEVLEAMARLQIDHDWLVVRTYVEHLIEDLKNNAIVAHDVVALRQLQGKTQSLTYLLNTMAEAEKLVRNPSLRVPRR